MKRGAFDQEGDDPSVPPNDGSSPIGVLNPDLLYNLFVNSGFTVHELKALCSVNQKIRKACRNEYIWRKLYFLKVVRIDGLENMPEPRAREYIETVLMATPEGENWKRNSEFVYFNPYILLIAFAYAPSTEELQDDRKVNLRFNRKDQQIQIVTRNLPERFFQPDDGLLLIAPDDVGIDMTNYATVHQLRPNINFKYVFDET